MYWTYGPAALSILFLSKPFLAPSLLHRLPLEVRDHCKMLLNPSPDLRPTPDQLRSISFFQSAGALLGWKIFKNWMFKKWKFNFKFQMILFYLLEDASLPRYTSSKATKWKRTIFSRSPSCFGSITFESQNWPSNEFVEARIREYSDSSNTFTVSFQGKYCRIFCINI